MNSRIAMTVEVAKLSSLLCHIPSKDFSLSYLLQPFLRYISIEINKLACGPALAANITKARAASVYVTSAADSPVTERPGVCSKSDKQLPGRSADESRGRV